MFVVGHCAWLEKASEVTSVTSGSDLHHSWKLGGGRESIQTEAKQGGSMKSAIVLDEQPTTSKPKMYRRILFATDFSEASQAAIPVAAALAERFGARLLLLHVVSPIPYGMASPEGLISNTQPWEEIAEQSLEDLRHSPFFDGLRVTSAVRCGGTVDETLDLIAKEHVDMIVLGTHGATGGKKVLLGSVTEEICRRAPCPVITVSPHTDPHKVLLRGIRHVLYATDLSERSFAALPAALSIASENNAQITMLHVLPLAERELNATIITKSLLDQMKRNVCKAAGNITFDFVVDFGDAAETIVRYAAELDAGLVVVGIKPAFTGSSHFPGNVAYKVMANASCPVLTVRENAHSN
jgi:nucleotide-binding universal stress UspA family protein